jgi:hypothetical protein
MKNLILLSIVFLSFASCKKDYCVQLTDPIGDPCCIKCFRNEQQSRNFFIENAGKGYCNFCK